MVAVMIDERQLTVSEVADRLHVSEYTVREWLKTGQLQGFRLGGKRLGWRIRQSSLERFLAEREGRSPESAEAEADR